MSFLKSRIANESINESEDEFNDETNDTAVDESSGDTDPTNNDDIDDSTDNDNDNADGQADGDNDGDSDSAGDDDTNASNAGEDGDGAADEINEEAEQARVEGEEVEADLDAEEELATESYELCGELNNVVSVANALESVSEFIHASMKNGSYNPVTSTFVNEQVNHHLARLNQKATALVAMEADADPAAQAGVAIQNKGTIRAMWDRMIQIAKNALNNVLEFIKQRTDRIMTATGRMRARATAVAKHLDKKETTMRALNSPRMVAAIGVDGKVSDLGGQLDTATAFVDYFTSETSYNHLKAIVNAASEKNDGSIKKMGVNLKQLNSTWRTKLNKTLLEEKGWITSDLLPGNIVFAAMVPDVVDNIQNLKTAVKSIPAKGEIGGEIAAIDIAQAKVIASKIIRGLDVLDKARKSEAIKSLESGFSKLVNDAKKADDEANASVTRAALNTVIRLITASASAPSVTFTAGWLRIASSYLDYLSSASSFGFVSQATYGAGDKLDAAGAAAKGAYDSTKARAGSEYDKRLKPHVDKASAAVKPVTDRASAMSGDVKNRFNSTMNSAKSGMSNLAGRFGGDKTASA